MGIPHALQRNKKFAKQFPYFVSFVYNNPSVQLAILAVIYNSQTNDEKKIGQTIYLNHEGIAKGEDARLYTEIYKTWLGNGKDYNNLNSKHIAKLLTIHRYYPQFCRKMVEQKRFNYLANVNALYEAHAVKCEDLIHRINQYIAAHENEDIDIRPFMNIKEKTEGPYFLKNLEQKFKEAQENKIIYVQNTLF